MLVRNRFLAVLMALVLLLAACVSVAARYPRTDVADHVDRIVDAEYNNVCYLYVGGGGISCVHLPDVEARRLITP